MSKKSLSFSATFGVAEGYFHDNEGAAQAAPVVSVAWQEAAAEVFAKTSVYVSAVVAESLTMYHTEWGCPAGGEKTATVRGEANPAFVTGMAAWKAAVVAVCEAVKARLKQTTVAVVFGQVEEFAYLAE